MIQSSTLLRPSEEESSQITIELTNTCNLGCKYCLRDDDALHHTPAHFFSLELLQRILRDARKVFGPFNVSFTGGEVTLHPQFEEIFAVIEREGLKAGFVTNGWHFNRVYKALLLHRAAIRSISFSLDGATPEAHDRWRGKGSFVRVIRAITRCYVHKIPFSIRVILRRDTVTQLEQIALLAARLGAGSVIFGHLLPVTSELARELMLTLEERKLAEQEIGSLGKILKMPLTLAVGSYDIDPTPPCAALRNKSCNVDYRGRLTLCCNLSGFNGAVNEPDVAADLTTEDFATGYMRLKNISEKQVAIRRAALASNLENGTETDLYAGSPCLFCLQSFNKIPWHTSITNKRHLPVIAAGASRL